MSRVQKERKKRQGGNGTIFASGRYHASDMKKCKGSFSIEAACIVPIVILCMALPMQMGISMLKEMDDVIERQRQCEILDMVSCMYQREFLKEILGEFYED